MQYEEADNTSGSHLSNLTAWVQQRLAGKKVYDLENPAPVEPPKFESSDPKLAAYFKEFGYVVVKNVASESEVAAGISLFWDLCEKQVPSIKRNDPSTWGDSTWVASTVNGIAAGYGIGQSEFLWHARLLPKVKEAFAHIWETDDLLVSFDGCGVFRPPEYDPKWLTRGAWYHIDQNLVKRPGLHAVQGAVNFFPSGPTDGGFVVVPKSHRMMDEAVVKHPDLFGARQADYFPMHADMGFWQSAREAITKRTNENKYDLLPVKVNLDPGDLVLWDSRSIHCNHPPTKISADPDAKNRLKRLAAYVCMTPAKLAANIEELAKKRIFAFHKGVTTTHWPHEFYPSWSARQGVPGVGAEVVKLTPEQATLITGKQVGYDVYDLEIVKEMDDALAGHW